MVCQLLTHLLILCTSFWYKIDGIVSATIFKLCDATTQDESISDKLLVKITIFFILEMFQKIGSLNASQFIIFSTLISCEFKNINNHPASHVTILLFFVLKLGNFQHFKMISQELEPFLSSLTKILKLP
jgi:hypothetical protein